MATGTIKTNDWKLLWTNPNSAATFAPQTIPLDLSSFSEVGVYARNSPLNTVLIFGQTLIGWNGIVDIAPNTRYREFQVTTAGVQFFEGHTANTTIDNQYMIPYQIYGR